MLLTIKKLPILTTLGLGFFSIYGLAQSLLFILFPRLTTVDFLETNTVPLVILIAWLLLVLSLATYWFISNQRQSSWLIGIALMALLLIWRPVEAVWANDFYLVATAIVIAIWFVVFRPMNIVIPRWLAHPWWLIALAVIWYSAITFQRHHLLNSHAFDLGIFSQIIWKYAHAEGLYSTIRGVPLLSDHFHPILLLLAPIYYLWQHAGFLLLIQALSVGLGGYAAYQLAYRKFHHRGIALGSSAVFLFALGIQSAVNFDFHPIIFAPTAILFLALWRDAPKWKYWLLVLITLMIQENVAPYVAAWALYDGLRHFEWRRQLATIAVAAIWFLVVLKLVMPAIGGSSLYTYEYNNDFPQLGDTFFEAGVTAITNPGYTAWIATHPEIKQETQGSLLAGGAFLPLLAPAAWIAAAPMYFEQFLFAIPAHWGFTFHYAAAITAPMILAVLDGLATFLAGLTFVFHRKKFDKTILLGGISIVLFLVPLFLSLSHRSVIVTSFKPSFWQTPDDIRLTYDLMRAIPPRVSVATTHSLVPHLTNRSDIIAWPPNVPTPALLDLHAEYLFFSLAGDLWPNDLAGQKRMIRDFIVDPAYGLVKSNGVGYLFEKGQADDPALVSLSESFLGE